MIFDYRIILGILFVLIFALIKRKQDNRNTKDKSSPIDPGNLDDQFFENLKGNEVIPFLRTYNPSDLMILRSLLDSNGINSMVNFSRMNSLYPNLRIDGHTDTIIYIYRMDQEKAVELAEEYIRNISSGQRISKGGIVRNVAEMAIGGILMASLRNRTLPEIIT